MLVINRALLRGQKLKYFCTSAKTIKHKTIDNNIMIFCYGNDLHKDECKKCRAYLGEFKK